MFGRHEERHVGRVLVRQQGLARRRLPDHVVLQQAHARLARELGREARVALGQRDVREPAVGLPDVAQLPRALRRRDAGRVVDLVGREARLPLVLEAGVEALARSLDLVLGEPVLDDQEAVALVGWICASVGSVGVMYKVLSSRGNGVQVTTAYTARDVALAPLPAGGRGRADRAPPRRGDRRGRAGARRAPAERARARGAARRRADDAATGAADPARGRIRRDAPWPQRRLVRARRPGRSRRGRRCPHAQRAARADRLAPRRLVARPPPWPRSARRMPSAARSPRRRRATERAVGRVRGLPAARRALPHRDRRGLALSPAGRGRDADPGRDRRDAARRARAAPRTLRSHRPATSPS